jgi:hypothetical protein
VGRPKRTQSIKLDTPQFCSASTSCFQQDSKRHAGLQCTHQHDLILHLLSAGLASMTYPLHTAKLGSLEDLDKHEDQKPIQFRLSIN